MPNDKKPAELEQMLDVNDLSKRLKLSKSYIYKLIMRQKLPPGVMIGHAHRWTVSEIEDWLRSKRVKRE